MATEEQETAGNGQSLEEWLSNRAEEDSEELAKSHSLHAEIATLKVGPDAFMFYMHRGKLAKSAPFFQRALESGFVESEQGEIHLPEDDVDTVKRYQRWMYGGGVGVSSLFDAVRLYVFAEKVSAESLKTDVIGKLWEYFYEIPSKDAVDSDVVHLAWTDLPRNCSLQLLIFDFTLNLLEGHQVPSDYPDQFYKDFACYAVKASPSAFGDLAFFRKHLKPKASDEGSKSTED